MKQTDTKATVSSMMLCVKENRRDHARVDKDEETFEDEDVKQAASVIEAA